MDFRLSYSTHFSQDCSLPTRAVRTTAPHSDAVVALQVTANPGPMGSGGSTEPRNPCHFDSIESGSSTVADSLVSKKVFEVFAVAQALPETLFDVQMLSKSI